MLDTIRRAQPTIIKGVLGGVVIAFVATIFLEWGWQRTGRPTTQLGSIGDEIISVREYQLVYENMVDSLRRMNPDRFNEEALRTLLRQQALESLVQRKLLLYEAKRQGLTVSDAELIEKVQSYPAFQVDGTFERNRYVLVLRQYRLTPGDFERDQREALLLDKLEHLIKDSIQVTESEIQQAYLRDKEQVNVEYLIVDPVQFVSQVEVSGPDVSAYFQEHQERFRKPEQVRVAYVIMDPESFSAQVEVTEETLQQYYEQHREDFRQEEQVRVRHILFKLSPQASTDEEARAREEAEAILTKIRAGEDFAELARKFSEDPASAEQGGDLGFFGRGAMVKPFEDTAFALSAGEVSDLVRTDYGYHLIKVEAVQEARVLPLDSVRPQLMERLTREEGQRLAAAQAQAVYDALTAPGGQWDTTMQRLGLTVQETPFIGRGHAVEGVENSFNFLQVAFALHEGEVSQPTLFGSRHFIIKLLERKESYIPALEEVTEAVSDALVQDRSRQLARRKADELLDEVKAGKSLESVAASANLAVAQTGLFSRSGVIPTLGRPLDFINEAFRLAVGEARLVTLQGKPAVARLTERTTFDTAAYEQERVQFRQTLLRRKRDQTFAQWVSDLRRQLEDRNEISLNQSLLSQL